MRMTTLERWRNWKISVYGREHGTPHIHVVSSDFRAVVEIATSEVLAGHLPPKVLLEVQQWLWDIHNPS